MDDKKEVSTKKIVNEIDEVMIGVQTQDLPENMTERQRSEILLRLAELRDTTVALCETADGECIFAPCPRPPVSQPS